MPATQQSLPTSCAWQPYPNHPEIRALTEQIAGIQARIEAVLEQAAISGDWQPIDSLIAQRTAIERQRAELTQAVIDNVTLTPWWRPCTELDAEQGATSCLECGNRIASTEEACSYCGWTYVIERPS